MSATGKSGHLVPTLMAAAYPAHRVKCAARAADVPIETARNWWRGRATPSAETLFRWAARCDAMARALEARLHADRTAREGFKVARGVPSVVGDKERVTP